MRETEKNCENKVEHNITKIKTKYKREAKRGNQLKLNVRVVVNIQIVIKRNI